MEITAIDLTPIEAEMDRPVSGSTYTKERRASIVVTVETDGDVRGRVYSGFLMDVDVEHGRRLMSVIEDDLSQLVVGEELFSVKRLWRDMFRRTRSVSPYDETLRCIYLSALSSVDLALWDAIGKRVDQPLYKLWGGAHDSIPVIAIGGYYEQDRDLRDIRDEIERFEELGVGGIKFKIGGETIEEDFERVRAAHDAASDDFEIAVDANRGYTIEEAIEIGKRLDELDVVWFEEPVVWYDQYEGMRRVREELDMPVVAGQSEILPKGCKRLVEGGSVDVLNYDAAVGGGATAWRWVAGFARAHNVPMGHHQNPQAGIQLLASTLQNGYAEVFGPGVDPFWYDLVENTPTIENGRLRLPDAPGFGLELDPEYIEAHTMDMSDV